MDQAALVGVLQAQRRLPDVVAGLRDRQRPALLDQLGQVGPLDVLHDEEVRAADRVGVEGVDDVGVRRVGETTWISRWKRPTASGFGQHSPCE